MRTGSIACKAKRGEVEKSHRNTRKSSVLCGSRPLQFVYREVCVQVERLDFVNNNGGLHKPVRDSRLGRI